MLIIFERIFRIELIDVALLNLVDIFFGIVLDLFDVLVKVAFSELGHLISG